MLELVKVVTNFAFRIKHCRFGYALTFDLKTYFWLEKQFIASGNFMTMSIPCSRIAGCRDNLMYFFTIRKLI